MIGRGVDASADEPQYLPRMRLRVAINRWGDAAVALAFAVWTQLGLWGHAPATMEVVGGRGVLSALLLLVTLPLAFRRRRPAAVLLTAAGALVVVALLVSHSHGIPVEVFLALLLAFYSVGAHCDDRRSALVGALAVAAIHDPVRLVAGSDAASSVGGSPLFQSTDGGNTWTALTTPSTIASAIPSAMLSTVM